MVRMEILYRIMQIIGLYVLVFASMLGCASIHQDESYKNPEIVLFHASKVLVVGMTRDFRSREKFETAMREEFRQGGVEAIRSIDLFDVTFTDSRRSEEELDIVEQQLLGRDIDAILFTKLVGEEPRRSFGDHIKEFDRTYDRFRDDYLMHQEIFYAEEDRIPPKVYYTETSLYCICVGKKRELIWRSNSHITRTRNEDKVIRHYVRQLINSMEAQQLIIGPDPF